MVIKVIQGDETIFMDDVDFINKDNFTTTVTTRDKTETEFASPEAPVEITVFTDSGIKIGEE